MRSLTKALIAINMLFTLTGCGSKYAADKELKELCAKDGSMKVYEKVTFPASEFNQYGEPLYQYRTLGRSKPEDILGPDYRYVQQHEFLKNGDTLKGEVRIRKSTTKVFRRSDDKLLGEEVSYGRSGCDPYLALLLGSHPSSFSCGGSTNELLKTLFIQGNQSCHQFAVNGN